MELDFRSRVKNAWNAFRERDPTRLNWNVGSSSVYRPDRVHFSGGNERSIVTSVYNRIAMDAAAIKIEHVKLDDDKRYEKTMVSTLNDCLSIEANIDQSGRAFRQDVFMSLLDWGSVAIVPTSATANPNYTDSYKITSFRTGKILEWRPTEVKIQLYNELKGEREEIWMSKKIVGIVENPLYAVMNERSSTMQRLIRKLNLLDAIDEQSGSGKLDLLIQLPYIVKTPARKEQAEARRQEIENQLANSKYGIAYTDGTEKVTQLNRPVENNLMKQIEYLTSMLYSQLGITQSIMDGTADEKTMTNYFSRTIDPLVSAVVEEMRRKFLTKTARSQSQSIMYFRDAFSLIPVTDLAEIVDKFTRNEVATSNEMRQVIGWKPSKDPKADMLVNSNLNHPEQSGAPIPEDPYAQSYDPTEIEEIIEEGVSQNG
jgi:hypothetical protein